MQTTTIARITHVERAAIIEALDQYVSNGRDAENLGDFEDNDAGLARVVAAESLLDQLNAEDCESMIGWTDPVTRPSKGLDWNAFAWKDPQ